MAQSRYDAKDAASAQGLRERIAVLLASTSQAELARKTGTSKMNISRYLAGTKIPAEFCMALVSNLGVNPAWLLAGEGAPHLANASLGEEADNMRSDVQAVIRAMEAVSRIKLGALAGKEHLKKLRELNDTLLAYEDRLGKVNGHVEGLVDFLSQEFARALRGNRFAQARDLVDAAKQAARLCSNPVQLRVVMQNEANLDFLMGRTEHALDSLRRTYLGALTEASATETSYIHIAHNFALTLYVNGYLEEARRVCRSALALLDHGENVLFASRLQCLLGMTENETGRIAKGLPRIQRAQHLVGDGYAGNARAMLLRGLLLSGGVPPLAAPALGAGTQSAQRQGILAACTIEDFDALRELVRGERSLDDSATALTAFANAHARQLLAVLAKPDRESYERARDDLDAGAPDRGSVRSRIRVNLALCQIARHAGLEDDMRQHWQAAEDSIGKLPKGAQCTIFEVAAHHRDAQFLARACPDDAQARHAAGVASEFFYRHVRKGYGLFVPFSVANRS